MMALSLGDIHFSFSVSRSIAGNEFGIKALGN
jgi:hypothetical protein